MRPYLYMLCGCAWFSAMGLLTNSLKETVDWQITTIFRSGLATLFALMLALATKTPLTVLGTRILWMRSLAGSCSMLATFYALTHMPVSDALTITNTFPIWIALISWPLFGERPTVGVMVAVLSSVVGVAFTQGGHPDGLTFAALSALAASFFTSVAMLGLNRLQGVPSIVVVVHFSAVSTLFGVLAYFLFDRNTGIERLAEMGVLTRLFGIGFTATVGQVFLTLAFKQGTATKVAVVGLSQVVMVMLAELAIHDRSFDWWTLLGTTLVLGPTAWLMVRARRTRIEHTDD